MKLPRFTIRETLMLTTIVALLIPYIYRELTKSPQLDLSFDYVKSVVKKIEPQATLLRGGGDNEFSDMTYLLPVSSSKDFVTRIWKEVLQHAEAEGWQHVGIATGTDGGDLSRFAYDFRKANARCDIRFIQLHRKASAPSNGQSNSEEIRFLFIAPQLH